MERHQAALSEAHVTILSLEVELEAKTHEAQLSWAQVSLQGVPSICFVSPTDPQSRNAILNLSSSDGCARVGQVEVFAQLVAGLEVERTEAEARLDEANSELHTQGQALQTQQDRVAQLQTALDDARLQHRQLTQHLADSRSDTDKQVRHGRSKDDLAGRAS